MKLISQGKDLACRCPWHEGDDTPSCIVSPTTNLWHCFGCDAGGSVIDWVMRRHRVSFRHACELLAKQHPALAAAASTNTAPTAAVKLSAGKLRAAQSFSLATGDQELLDQVIDFWLPALLSDIPGGVGGMIGAFQTYNAYNSGDYLGASQAGGATLGGGF